MNEESIPQGEFHHFHLVNTDGEVPVSISVLVHFNTPRRSSFQMEDGAPIGANDIIELHDALEEFDGDYIKAFQAN
jgi:hypothetical protein